jgi:hypothetical protein
VSKLCPNRLAWCLTQHIGEALDHHVGWMSKLAPNGLGWRYTQHNGQGLIILLGGVQAWPKGLAWCLTQHWQGLDHSVGWVSKLALTGLVGTLPNIMGKGLIILLGSVQACPNRLTWCLTQHIWQGLDHSVGWISKLALMGLLGAFSDIFGKGLDDFVGCINKLI